jgi:hypothetical protein
VSRRRLKAKPNYVREWFNLFSELNYWSARMEFLTYMRVWDHAVDSDVFGMTNHSSRKYVVFWYEYNTLSDDSQFYDENCLVPPDLDLYELMGG